jgi:hypothetical protein
MRAYLFLARYWKDPHTFKPSRFLEDWPRDAFIPFSAGKHGPLKHLLPQLIHRTFRSAGMPRAKVRLLNYINCFIFIVLSTDLLRQKASRS